MAPEHNTDAPMTALDEQRPAKIDGSRIMHVVGCVTDEVFSFLGPATDALETTACSQVVIALDEPMHRANVEQLGRHARVLNVPKTGNFLESWRRMFSCCVREIRAGMPDAIHMHGVLPCIAASLAVRSTGSDASLVYSPHGSRSLPSFRFLEPLSMQVAGSSQKATIVTVPSEAVTLNDSALVESPVHEAFFSMKRCEDEFPLVISGGRQNSARSLHTFSQLAVLLGGVEPGLRFRWLGSADDAFVARLTAAAVVVAEPVDERACASELAAGWIYVAPWHKRGFPLFLVKAMAAGLPCVASDCPQHREVIEDGHSGFLCATEEEMMHRIALLVGDPQLRLSIGTAARQVASTRFRTKKFSEKLLQVYLGQSRLAEEKAMWRQPGDLHG